MHYSYAFVVAAVVFHLCLAENCSDENSCDKVDEWVFPVIDMMEFFHGDAETRRIIADKMDSAMQQTGFFYLVNHGVSHEIIESFYNATNDFFSSPAEHKNKYHYVAGGFKNLSDLSVAGGFKPFGVEKQPVSESEESVGADMVESFEFVNLGHDWLLTGPPMDALPSQFAENGAARNYMREVRSALTKLNFLASFALDLSENEFEKLMLSHPNKTSFANSLRTNYYFPLADDDKLNGFGIGSHTDFLGFTILYTDHVAGLQAKVKGEWVDVPPRADEDAFIVNAGDLIRVWTHNRWKSAEHRVVRKVKDSRISVAYFSGPSMETLVEPFRGCVKCSMTTYEHFIEKINTMDY